MFEGIIEDLQNKGTKYGAMLAEVLKSEVKGT